MKIEQRGRVKEVNNQGLESQDSQVSWSPRLLKEHFGKESSQQTDLVIFSPCNLTIVAIFSVYFHSYLLIAIEIFLLPYQSELGKDGIFLWGQKSFFLFCSIQHASSLCNILCLSLSIHSFIHFTVQNDLPGDFTFFSESVLLYMYCICIYMQNILNNVTMNK